VSVDYKISAWSYELSLATTNDIIREKTSHR
jgi:hypothetical protein